MGSDKKSPAVAAATDPRFDGNGFLRPPPPKPKIMGEEVEDTVKRLRDMASAWKRWGTDGVFNGALHSDIIDDAAREIESLRASLTRVEEERDERGRVMNEAIDLIRALKSPLACFKLEQALLSRATSAESVDDA